MDMGKVVNFCDYFVIFSASSLRKVGAIADSIIEGLSKDRIKPLSRDTVAGQKGSGWVLLDFGSIIVHIFYKPLREFYSLEHLWQDAPHVKIRKTMK